MDFLDALLLGLIQGLTEFFPISSSAHLMITEHLLGFKDLKKLILFDLVCHLGTLGAILIVLYPPLKETFSKPRQRIQLLLATLPLFPLVLLLKPIQQLFTHPALLGYTLLTTACILWFSNRFSSEKSKAALEESPYKDALKIGCAQAFAIIPGLSRSGMTISTAKLLGWPPLKAAEFSFILSIPTVLGGMTLESIKLLKSTTPTSDVPLLAYITGATASFILGIFTLKLLLRIVGTAKFQVFTWYCAALGSWILYLFS